MATNVFVYNDKGTHKFSADELKSCLTEIYPNMNVQFINSNDIKNGILLQNGQLNTKLFCIGGGRDLGYVEKLGDIGCKAISEFVYNGGWYLGLCAGAYFASDFIEFDLNGPLEVKGDRKLKFFNGKCIGPVNKQFQYDTESTAEAIEILFSNKIINNSILNSENFYYMDGGCKLIPYKKNDKNIEIIANYKHDTNDPAIIKCYYGKGKCLLSGLHIEYDPSHLNTKNKNIKENVLPKLNYTKYFLLKNLLSSLEDD